MTKLILIYSSFLFLLNLGCGSQKVVESSDKEKSVAEFPDDNKDEIDQEDQSFEITDNMEIITNDAYNVSSFGRFPEAQSGCYNYFANSKKDYDKEQFIYAFNNQKQAVISIYNQLIYLSNKSSTKNGPKQIVEEWNSSNYKVIIILNELEVLDNDKIISGSLNIMDKEGNVVSKVLYGKINC